MALNGQTPADRAEQVPEAQEAWSCEWVQVSWEDLARLCRRLVAQIRDGDRPEVVVALARAGYVPGAILASLLRCDLLTLAVPPARERGPEIERVVAASLRDRLSGRCALVFDETSRTGESLAWAVGIVTDAGATAVHTAVLVRPRGGSAPDYWAATADVHLLQPWVRDSAKPAE